MKYTNIYIIVIDLRRFRDNAYMVDFIHGKHEMNILDVKI